MAKSGQERSAKAAEKRIEYDEKDCAPGQARHQAEA